MPTGGSDRAVAGCMPEIVRNVGGRCLFVQTGIAKGSDANRPLSVLLDQIHRLKV